MTAGLHERLGLLRCPVPNGNLVPCLDQVERLQSKPSSSHHASLYVEVTVLHRQR